MTPAARRILHDLAADERCDLIREGIRAYCGSRAVASRTVSELVWSAAIRPIAPVEGSATYYSITNMGRAYLRRPELEDEYRNAVASRAGPFTVRDDRIVPLQDPRR